METTLNIEELCQDWLALITDAGWQRYDNEAQNRWVRKGCYQECFGSLKTDPTTFDATDWNDLIDWTKKVIAGQIVLPGYIREVPALIEPTGLIEPRLTEIEYVQNDFDELVLKFFFQFSDSPQTYKDMIRGEEGKAFARAYRLAANFVKTSNEWRQKHGREAALRELEETK